MTDSTERKNIITGLVIIIILGAGIFLLIMMEIMFNEEIKDPRIHLVGKVTDMNNRELEDVTLRLEFNRPINFGLDSEHIRETRTINGSFTIKKSRYTSVSISFYKPGYRIEHITFYTSKEANNPLSAIQENCPISS